MIFLSLKRVSWFFPLWNRVFCGTCCVVIFFREIQFILIFFFVKLVVCWFILSLYLIYHGIFLCETCSSYGMFFVKPEACWFCSWNLLHVDYFFKKLNVSWFTSSRNFFFLFHETCWMLILRSLKLEPWFFCSWNQVCSLNLSRVDFLSRSLIYLDIFLNKFCF